MGDNVKKLEYGIADKAWHPVVGCDPHMPCAPRCWARKTEARTVECLRKDQPERAAFYQIALTPNLRQWSGKVLIDEAHLNDPLKWRKAALIATGFHGDIGRLPWEDFRSIIAVTSRCPMHRFILLTKQPATVIEYSCKLVLVGNYVPENVTIGCSVMNQAEADRQRPAMAALGSLGWHTHCWYEPALGPVDWTAWEFLEMVICGGESGPGSRPMHPQWARDTRDWCQRTGVAFRFKQHGDWTPITQENRSAGDKSWVWHGGWGVNMVRVGKRAAGNLLDGQEHNGLPDWMRV